MFDLSEYIVLAIGFIGLFWHNAGERGREIIKEAIAGVSAVFIFPSMVVLALVAVGAH